MDVFTAFLRKNDPIPYPELRLFIQNTVWLNPCLIYKPINAY